MARRRHHRARKPGLGVELNEEVAARPRDTGAKLHLERPHGPL